MKYQKTIISINGGVTYVTKEILNINTIRDELSLENISLTKIRFQQLDIYNFIYKYKFKHIALFHIYMVLYYNSCQEFLENRNF